MGTSIKQRMIRLEAKTRPTPCSYSMPERVARTAGLLAVAAEGLGVDSGDLQSIATRATGPAANIAQRLLRVQS